jgi:hypothetical protein
VLLHDTLLSLWDIRTFCLIRICSFAFDGCTLRPDRSSFLSLFERPDDILFVGIANLSGFHLVDLNTNVIQRRGVREAFCLLCLADIGVVWVATKDGIEIYEWESFSLINFIPLPTSISSLYQWTNEFVIAISSQTCSLIIFKIFRHYEFDFTSIFHRHIHFINLTHQNIRLFNSEGLSSMSVSFSPSQTPKHDWRNSVAFCCGGGCVCCVTSIGNIQHSPPNNRKDIPPFFSIVNRHLWHTDLSRRFILIWKIPRSLDPLECIPKLKIIIDIFDYFTFLSSPPPSFPYVCGLYIVGRQLWISRSDLQIDVWEWKTYQKLGTLQGLLFGVFGCVSVRYFMWCSKM